MIVLFVKHFLRSLQYLQEHAVTAQAYSDGPRFLKTFDVLIYNHVILSEPLCNGIRPKSRVYPKNAIAWKSTCANAPTMQMQRI